MCLASVSLPKNYHEALNHPEWKQAMDAEMSALISRGTKELVALTLNVCPAACKRVFTIKHSPDGSIERYKTHLVAKGFAQTYSIDYFETFSPIARLSSIRIIISIAVNLD